MRCVKAWFCATWVCRFASAIACDCARCALADWIEPTSDRPAPTAVAIPIETGSHIGLSYGPVGNARSAERSGPGETGIETRQSRALIEPAQERAAALDDPGEDTSEWIDNRNRLQVGCHVPGGSADWRDRIALGLQGAVHILDRRAGDRRADALRRDELVRQVLPRVCDPVLQIGCGVLREIALFGPGTPRGLGDKSCLVDPGLTRRHAAARQVKSQITGRKAALVVDLVLRPVQIVVSVVLEILRRKPRKSGIDRLLPLAERLRPPSVVLRLTVGLFLDLTLLLFVLLLLLLNLLLVELLLLVRDLLLRLDLSVRQILRRHLLILRDRRCTAIDEIRWYPLLDERETAVTADDQLLRGLRTDAAAAPEKAHGDHSSPGSGPRHTKENPRDFCRSP